MLDSGGRAFVAAPRELSAVYNEGDGPESFDFGFFEWTTEQEL